MRLSSEAFQQRSSQSRFANPRLTGEQHDLTFAGFRFGPAPQQQFEFFFTPDKLGHPARVQSLEAAFHRSLARNAAQALHRPCDALEVLCSQGPQARTDCRGASECSLQ